MPDDLMLYGPRGEVLSRLPDRVSIGVAAPRPGSPSYDAGIVVEDDDATNQDWKKTVFPYTAQPDQPHRMQGGWDDFFVLWLRNPTVSACVQLIAGAMMRRGWRLVPAPGYEDSADEGNHDLLAAFYAKCHPYWSIGEILGATLPVYVLANRAFLEVAYTDLAAPTDYGRQPGALFEIPAQGSITARLDKYGTFLTPAWVQRMRQAETGGERRVTFDWEQILWLRYPDLVRRGIFAVSPVEKLELPIQTNNAAKSYIHSYFTTGGKVGLVFVIPPGAPNAKSKAESWLRYIDTWYRRTDKAHRTMVLYDGMTVENAPSAQKDTQVWIDVQAFSRDEICAVFGVDPRLVAADRGGTLGGKGEREQAWVEFMANAVEPRVRQFDACWTEQIHRQGFGIEDWVFELVPERVSASEEARSTLVTIHQGAADLGLVDLASVDEVNRLRAEVFPDWPALEEVPAGTRKARELYQYDYQAGIVTINEARAGKGLPPIPGGEVLLKFVEPVSSAGAGTGTGTGARERSSPWVRRFDARGARSHLDAAEEAANAVIRPLLREMQGRLTEKLDRLYTAGDLKAIRLPDFQWRPGGAALLAACKSTWLEFYLASIARTEKELKAAVKETRVLKTDSVSGGTSGDVQNFLDLVSTRFFEDLTGKQASEARDTFIEGVEAGWDRKTFVAKLAERFDLVDDAEVSTAVRTEATQFYNLARQRVFEGAGDEVESVEFSAILDDRTTEVCERMDGLIFKNMGDPNLDGARPPLHYNCRSVLIPIMQGDDWTPTPSGRMASAMKFIHAGFGKRCRHGW